MRILLYFLPKLIFAAITMLGVSALVFLALRMIPGGYADVLLGPFVTPEAREAIAVRYGLDQPLLVQYLNWLGALFQGDLGVSMVTRAPVLDEFLRRAPVTLELALLALVFALAGGLPLGILAGIAPPGHRGGILARLVGALGASVPDFVLGSLLIFVFSVWSLWLRVGGYVSPIEDPVGNLRTMLLPALTLSLFGIALVLRTTRDAVLRVMTEGYITTALARGERPFDIIRLHVLRNSAIPIVTVVTTYFGFLLGGAVVVEVLFSIPGIGFFIFSGLENRDYAIVQAGVLIAAAVFVSINMLADLAYALIDPRVGSGRH
ncbi:MAG: ABC transporter permease [Pseudodonghicola sp.]|nr:ABC transporter permease [Pseudodonghicola sp.]